MIFAPGKEELFSVLNITGKILIVLGMLFLVPAAIAFYFKEINPLYDFLISFCLAESLGFLLMIFFPFRKNPGLSLAFLLVALLWLIIPLLGAVPLFLSSHFNSFLDAFFESMSGFATTGLSLITDIDHAPYSINFWRHFIMFLGGQGIILVVLSFFGGSSSIGMDLYVGEAREERILPNIIDTARFIWMVSIVYFIIGTGIIFFLLLRQGFNIDIALLHSSCLFMAAFDTGGFTPQSMNIYYYHSIMLEIVLVFLMMLGMLNFNLHYYIWTKKKREIFRNVETRTLIVSLSLILIAASAAYLSACSGISFAAFFRKIFFQIISAHSGCGFSNIRVVEMASWPQLSVLAVIIAMSIGGSVGSTTGGIKLMRISVLFKTVTWEIKKNLVPPGVWVLQKYHHLHTRILEDSRIKIVLVVTMLYCLSYFTGAVAAMACGYDFFDSLFESVSAAANVGLSTGITSPDMPAFLKIVYILQMWLGRLEFLSVIAGTGLMIKAIVRRVKTKGKDAVWQN